MYLLNLLKPSHLSTQRGQTTSIKFSDHSLNMHKTFNVEMYLQWLGTFGIQRMLTLGSSFPQGWPCWGVVVLWKGLSWGVSLCSPPGRSAYGPGPLPSPGGPRSSRSNPPETCRQTCPKHPEGNRKCFDSHSRLVGSFPTMFLSPNVNLRNPLRRCSKLKRSPANT